MSQDARFGNILVEISQQIIKDIEYVKECDAIGSRIMTYYSTDVELLESGTEWVFSFSRKRRSERMKQRDIKAALRVAEYYRMKARNYYNFFGIDFDDYSKSRVIKLSDLQNIEMKHLQLFLISSIQLMYVILWELFKSFLRPLENLYCLRIVESKLFPKDLMLFPSTTKIEESKLQLLDYFKQEHPFFRINLDLPFEMDLMLRSSPLFKKYLEVGLERLGMGIRFNDCVNDFIRLFILRNNICHIGRQLSMHEISTLKVQSLIYDLSTRLPRIQTSCLGLIEMFQAMVEGHSC